MLPSSIRLLPALARSAARYQRLQLNPALRVPNSQTRSLCANPAPAEASHPKSSSPAEASKSKTASPTTPKAAAETSTATPSEAPKSATASATTATTSQVESPQIPDVPSTSLGIEDPASTDPLRWKKFAWKYAGAVLLFMVSYKTLHWYVDRLEADGKRRREEMEENKRIAEEIRSGSQHQEPFTAASALPAGVVQGQDGNGGVGVQPEQMGPLRVFDQVKEEEPHLVSELEELYVYKVELQTKLRDLKEQAWSREVDAKKRDVETELKELAKEIRDLELKEGKQPTS